MADNGQYSVFSGSNGGDDFGPPPNPPGVGWSFVLQRLMVVPSREEVKADLATATKGVATADGVEAAVAKVKLWVILTAASIFLTLIGILIAIANLMLRLIPNAS